MGIGRNKEEGFGLRLGKTRGLRLLASNPFLYFRGLVRNLRNEQFFKCEENTLVK